MSDQLAKTLWLVEAVENDGTRHKWLIASHFRRGYAMVEAATFVLGQGIEATKLFIEPIANVDVTTFFQAAGQQEHGR